MSRKDPFRTLDDPAPAEPVEPTAAAHLAGAANPVGLLAEPGLEIPMWLRIAGWRIPLKRPNWARRLIVRLLLGWRWD